MRKWQRVIYFKCDILLRLLILTLEFDFFRGGPRRSGERARMYLVIPVEIGEIFEEEVARRDVPPRAMRVVGGHPIQRYRRLM